MYLILVGLGDGLNREELNGSGNRALVESGAAWSRDDESGAGTGTGTVGWLVV